MQTKPNNNAKSKQNNITNIVQPKQITNQTNQNSSTTIHNIKHHKQQKQQTIKQANTANKTHTTANNNNKSNKFKTSVTATLLNQIKQHHNQLQPPTKTPKQQIKRTNNNLSIQPVITTNPITNNQHRKHKNYYHNSVELLNKPTLTKSQQISTKKDNIKQPTKSTTTIK